MTIDQNFPKYGMHRKFPRQLWEAEVRQIIGKEIPDTSQADIWEKGTKSWSKKYLDNI